MKKTGALFCAMLAALLLVSSGVLASPKIGRVKAHNTKRGGKSVKSCVYCHTNPAKYPKKKAGYLKGQKNFKKMSRDKSCNGGGCHR